MHIQFFEAPSNDSNLAEPLANTYHSDGGGLDILRAKYEIHILVVWVLDPCIFCITLFCCIVFQNVGSRMLVMTPGKCRNRYPAWCSI